MSKLALRVSVVVATYNRPQKLVAMLEALSRQSLPKDCFEVVIVDDGSHKPLDQVLAPYVATLRIVHHRQENSGPSMARNAGIRLAGAKFVALMDDDCAPAVDWLELLTETLEANPDAMVGGHTINALTDNLYSTVSQMIVDRVYAAHNADPQRAGFFTGGNFGVRKDLLLQLGGFDIRYRYAGGEDRALCDRWRHSGHRMIHVPQARVLHYHNLSLRSFLRQHFHYGRGAIVYHRTRVSTTAEESATAREIVFNWGAWRREIQAKRGRHPVAGVVSLLFLWQFANAAGYFWETVVSGTRFAATDNRIERPAP